MNTNINVRKMTTNGILLALGALLHQITPALGFPMQPDFAVMMLIIIIYINKDYKTALISSIIIGVFTALTTKFLGGQVPNIIDKLITGNVVYFLFLMLKNKLNDNIKMIIALPLGTVVSGFIFLTSALLSVGLPGRFLELVLAIVVPAAILNLFLGVTLYKVVIKSLAINNMRF
jgi:Tryptophan transporter TrpP